MEKILDKGKALKNGIAITKQDLITFIISILSFFLGRVVIFQTLSPVAIAFLSNFNFVGTKFYFIEFFICLGFFTKTGKIYFLKYIICLGFMTIANLITKNFKRPNEIVQSATGSISILLAGLIISILNGFSIYYTLLAILESILTFSLSYIFKKSTDLFYFKNDKKTLNNEEIFSIAILMGSIIAGSADVYIGNVSLMYFFLSYSLMVVSYKCGSALGSVAGVILGTVLILANFCSVEIIGILSISSIVCGLLKKYGKIASAAGFIVFGGLAVYYFDITMANVELLFSSVGAGLIFIIVPNKFYIAISSTFTPEIDNTEEYILRVKEVTSHKLKKFSDSFVKLAKTFSGLSEKKTGLDQKDVSKLIDDVAEKTCNKCSMRTYCWENNFYNTYQTVFSILAACEKKGKLDLSDIPSDFKSNCVNLGLFAETTNRLFELYKANLVWKNRIIESRELVSQQLEGVAEIINGLAGELDIELAFKEDIGKKLMDEFSKNNISVDSAVVIENKHDKFEVIINHLPCFGRKMCTKDIIPIVNRILNRKMCKNYYECSINRVDKKNVCKLKLIEEQRFRITTGIARAVKANSKESGDSYTFMDLSNGRYLLALSDGMGSGKNAREESAASIELFEEFISAGFDKDMAIKMINSVLVLKSSEDCFSTLDICTFDLYTGLGEFVKISASSTFIIHEDKVDIIRSSTLPVGILNNIDVETSRKKLKDSDIIVMVTDGIIDSIGRATNKESWIIELLENNKINNPQEIADYILNAAKNNCSGNIKDDMTILTARVWEL